MQPPVQSVHIDRTLTNVSTAYFQDPSVYIAAKVAPTVRVDAQTNKYFTFNKNDTLREKARVRPPNTQSAGGGFNISTDSYSAEVFAWHVDLSDQVRGNADGGLNLERSAARQCTDAILRQMEADWAATWFATGVWGIDLDGITNFEQWSTDTSTPIQDIETQRVAILKSTGRRPNTLVLGAEVYSRLKMHPDFIERIRYVSDSVVTQQIMARLFEIDRILVAEAVAATNLEGETAAYGFMMGKHAWLGYVPSAPAMEEPSAGYIFTWDEVSDGGPTQVGTVRIEMPLERSIRIESQLAWDIKIVGTDMGAFFESAIA